jgi:hypothetical protein
MAEQNREPIWRWTVKWPLWRRERKIVSKMAGAGLVPVAFSAGCGDGDDVS